MSDLAAVRVDLAAALAAQGIVAYAALPNSPDLPAAVISFPEKIEYHQTYRGQCKYTIPVRLFVSIADEDTATSTIDAAVSLGDGSMVTALEGFTSSAWASLIVREANEFTAVTIGETTTAMSCQLVVELLA